MVNLCSLFFQLLNSPDVTFTSSDNIIDNDSSLYTVVMSNLDGHPQGGSGNEVVHWMM